VTRYRRVRYAPVLPGQPAPIHVRAVTYQDCRPVAHGPVGLHATSPEALDALLRQIARQCEEEPVLDAAWLDAVCQEATG
jgi:hypothetical protein